MFPASEASAPFGIRIVMTAVCSNESGMESRRTFTTFSCGCYGKGAPRESGKVRMKGL